MLSPKYTSMQYIYIHIYIYVCIYIYAYNTLYIIHIHIYSSSARCWVIRGYQAELKHIETIVGTFDHLIIWWTPIGPAQELKSLCQEALQHRVLQQRSCCYQAHHSSCLDPGHRRSQNFAGHHIFWPFLVFTTAFWVDAPVNHSSYPELWYLKPRLYFRPCATKWIMLLCWL